VTETVRSLEAAIALIEDGMQVVVAPDHSGVAMEATRSLIRRGVKNLRLVTLPASSLQADLLIGAKSLAEIETAAVSLGELGTGPRFAAAALAGDGPVIKDATCPVLHAAVQAGEKDVPFAMLRGVIGSDLLKVRPDWKVIDNPFAAPGQSDPILAVPAIKPDAALFHAPFADKEGNVWIGRRRELATAAHASKNCFVTFEEKQEGDMLEDELLAPGVVSSIYVSAVAHAPRGAWPLGLPGVYGADDVHVSQYAKAARTREGFQRYLEEWVLTPRKSSSPA